MLTWCVPSQWFMVEFLQKLNKQQVNVSCLLVNYFSAEMIQKALASVLFQSLENAVLKITLDVVLVDNSADPAEADRLRASLTDLQKKWPSAPHVQMLVNSVNTGFGQANNLAFSKCQGELVMLLNPDARMQANCLLALTETMLAHPTLGACCPMQYWDDEKTWQLPPAWLPTGIGSWSMTQAHLQQYHASRVSNAHRNLSLTSWQSTELSPQRAISGAAMMLRRSALKTSIFDPAYFMYFEDSDLSLRLQRAGWKLGMQPKAALVHDWSHSAGKVVMMAASKAIYFAKHFEGRGQWQQRLEKRSQNSAFDNPLRAKPMALKTNALKLQVPSVWAADWLLEASPSALLTPSMGRRGSGTEAIVDKALLSRMSFKPQGSESFSPVYVRLGPAQKTRESLQIFKIDLN